MLTTREVKLKSEGNMKELANSFAQLAAIIMILVTLAVSTAAISQWANADSRQTVNAGVKPQTLLASDTR
jgi:hypothetical protein